MLAPPPPHASLARLQLQQLVEEGGQSRGVSALPLLRMALLGILCAYAYLWLKARLN